MSMSFLPKTGPSGGSPVRVLGNVDYRLARNVVVSEFRKGRLSRLDICDAHPELLRAAADAGEEAAEDCPICEDVKLKLVSFVFGPRLPPSGRCVASKKELAKLARPGKDLACYVVEVCPGCAWNYLAQAFSLTAKAAAAH
jgi:Family of unknown function (DUF5318)